MRALGDALGSAGAQQPGTVFSTGQRFDEALAAGATRLTFSTRSATGWGWPTRTSTWRFAMEGQPAGASPRGALIGARTGRELSLPTLSAQIAAHPMNG